jgi:hypothetical protein
MVGAVRCTSRPVLARVLLPSIKQMYRASTSGVPTFSFVCQRKKPPGATTMRLPLRITFAPAGACCWLGTGPA